MINLNSNSSSLPNKLPAMLYFLTKCPNVESFIYQAEIDDKFTYSEARQLTIDNKNIPLYCSPSASPPTVCSTPGKTIPSGYTQSGKYKVGSYRPAKQDKRVGK